MLEASRLFSCAAKKLCSRLRLIALLASLSPAQWIFAGKMYLL
jgi:hypothetical protein